MLRRIDFRSYTPRGQVQPVMNHCCTCYLSSAEVHQLAQLAIERAPDSILRRFSGPGSFRNQLDSSHSQHKIYCCYFCHVDIQTRTTCERQSASTHTHTCGTQQQHHQQQPEHGLSNAHFPNCPLHASDLVYLPWLWPYIASAMRSLGQLSHPPLLPCSARRDLTWCLWRPRQRAQLLRRRRPLCLGGL